MSLIGEAEIGSPLLQGALAAAPGVVVHVEDIRTVDEETRLMFRAEGGDFDAFEDGLETDPTIATHRFIAAFDDSRLYRVTLSAHGQARSTYDVALAQDIVVFDQRVTDEGMQVQARVPDREALATYREACREMDIPFEIRRLYSIDESIDADRFGVTAAQAEALVHALETGYFDVPRRTDLQTMAEELDVSPQALSARLRRAQYNLVANTLDERSI
jgi:hypothetical protein